MDINEKEENLQNLINKTNETQSKIKEFYRKIYETENQRVEVEREIISLKCKQNYSLLDKKDKESNSSEEIELNEEHENILTSKVDVLRVLGAKAVEIKDQRKRNEEVLNTIKDDILNLTDEISQLQFDIQIEQNNSEKIRIEQAYLTNQVKERESEVKMMNNLKKEAEKQYHKVFQNEDSLNLTKKRNFEHQKADLQVQIDKINNQIEKLQSRITETEEFNQTTEQTNKEERKKFKSAVNWKAEEAELKAELKSLTEALAKKKEEESFAQKTQIKQAENSSNYAPYVKKWKGKGLFTSLKEDPEKLLISENPQYSQKTAQEIYTALQVEKEKVDEIKKNKQKQLSDLTIHNSFLEKELEKKRSYLKLLILDLQREQAKAPLVLKKKQDKAQEEENKLLQQIMEAKMKIAQRLLNQQ